MSTIFSKPLDKSTRLWYNINVIKRDYNRGTSPLSTVSQSHKRCEQQCSVSRPLGIEISRAKTMHNPWKCMWMERGSHERVSQRQWGWHYSTAMDRFESSLSHHICQAHQRLRFLLCCCSSPLRWCAILCHKKEQMFVRRGPGQFVQYVQGGRAKFVYFNYWQIIKLVI